jgi:hypothetical protein
MTNIVNCFLCLAAVTITLAAVASAEAYVLPVASGTAEKVAETKTYRHCHNTPRRTYCHTRERLRVSVGPCVQPPKGLTRD